MTDRREEDGYSVAPVRLGGGGSRVARGRRRLGLAVVLLASLAIVGVAVAGPRLSGRPNLEAAYFATPTPSPSPSPTPMPTVTPLPAITRGDSGPMSGRLPLLSDSFRMLDLGTGVQAPGFGINLGNDAVFAAPAGDGWICICMVDDYGEAQAVRDVSMIRLGPDGLRQDRTTLVTFTGEIDPDGPSPVQSDVAVAPDHRSALLVMGARSGQAWRYSAARIDLVAGTIGRLTALGEKRIPRPPAQPSPAPGATPLPVRTELYGPIVRRSPDGRSAFAWAWLQQSTDEQQLRAESFGWRIALDATGEITGTDGVKALSGIPQWCSAAGFLSDDRFLWICPDPEKSSDVVEPQPWLWLELDSLGAVVAREELPGPGQWYAEPLLDVANGAVWLWDPVDLTLARVSEDGKRVDLRQFSDAVPTPGDRSISAAPPVWARMWSSVGGQYPTQVVGSADGGRLYLLAWEPNGRPETGQQGSRGVLVVDPTTFAIVDRWAPEANYFSLQVVLDGTAVAATGVAQFDASGREVPWQASLTLHDAATGRVLVRFGQMGDTWSPFLVP
jgi:hypothetical protein